MEADTEEPSPLPPGGNTPVLPEEDLLLMGGRTHTEVQVPKSEVASVAGEIARLQICTPPCQKPEDDGTSQ